MYLPDYYSQCSLVGNTPMHKIMTRPYSYTINNNVLIFFLHRSLIIICLLGENVYISRILSSGLFSILNQVWLISVLKLALFEFCKSFPTEKWAIGEKKCIFSFWKLQSLFLGKCLNKNRQAYLIWLRIWYFTVIDGLTTEDPGIWCMYTVWWW